MATLEDISEYLNATVEKTFCSAKELKRKTSKYFDCILTPFDISFVEQKYVEIALKLWQEQGSNAIDKTVKNASDCENLLQFLNNSKWNFESLPSFLRTDAYDLIAKDRGYFNDDDILFLCNKFYNQLKAKIIEAREHTQGLFKFLETLIEVFRASHAKFVTVVEQLRLQDAVDGKITLCDVINLIRKTDFDIKMYTELQKLSEGLSESNNFAIKELIRKEISDYIAPLKGEIVNEEGRKIYRFSKKIMFLEDLRKYDSNRDEIRIICDVLHIGKETSGYETFSTLGGNLVIIANTIKIHDEYSLNLSGKNAENGSSGDAETDGNGVGNKGTDGYAGESGGVCSIECETIENSDLLTIISNGGNGTDGQNGGHGKDGVNGEDAQKSDFTYRGIKFSVTFYGGTRNTLFAALGRPKNSNFVRFGGSGFDNGHHKQFQIDTNGLILRWYGLLLVKGTDGTAGKSGGLGGLGGQGGYAGAIIINTTDDTKYKVSYQSTDGRAGVDGKAGYNGLNAKDGRDIWMYDQNNWSSPSYGGLSSNNKFEFAYSKNSSEFSVYDYDREQYAYITCVRTIRAVDSDRQRHSSSATRSRSDHAVAKRKSSASMRNVKSQNADYLQGSLNQARAEISKFTDIQCDMHFTTTKAKVSTKTTFQVAHDRKSKMKLIESEISKKFAFEDFEKKFEMEISFEEFLEMLKRSDLSHDECRRLKEMSAIRRCSYEIERFQKMSMRKKSSTAERETESSMELQELSLDVPFFMHYNQKVNSVTNNDMVNFEETLALWSEKIVLMKFQEELNVSMERKIEEFVKFSKNLETPTEGAKLVPYLVETNLFEFDPEDKDLGRLQSFYNSDSQAVRERMKQYFSKIRKEAMNLFDHSALLRKVTSVLPNKDSLDEYEKAGRYAQLFLSIIRVLFHYKSELSALREVLFMFEIEYRNDVEKLLESKETDNQKKVQIFIRKFFENKDISKFMYDLLLDYGILSPIYKKLIAFAFDIHVMIFITKIDGRLCIISDDNQTVLNSSSDLMQKPTIYILLKNKNYTTLKIDINKFLRDEERKFVSQKCQLELQQWNFKPESLNLAGNAFRNIFDKDDGTHNDLIKILLSQFPSTIADEVNYLKSVLIDIIAVNGGPLLKAMNIRLFHENNQMSIKEFSTIMMTVLDHIIANTFMIEYFTLRFLSMHHTVWICEIILLQISNYLNSFDSNFKLWQNFLNSVTTRKILLLFLNKIDKLEPGQMTESDFKSIIESMQYFCMGNYQNLLDIELISWKFIITTDYWIKNFSFLSRLSESSVLNLIINGLQSKYGSDNLKRLLSLMDESAVKMCVVKDKMLVEATTNTSKEESSNKSLNVVDFLNNFNNGEWIFSEELFSILENNPVECWMEKIQRQYSVSDGQRSINEIVHMISENPDTSETIKSEIKVVETQAFEINKLMCGKFSSYTEQDVQAWLKTKSSSVVECLAIVLQVFKIKLYLTLRHTQIVSILSLWHNSRGILIQIGTGEGKTYIGTVFAILKCLHKEKVDIITSSSVLAERDATDIDILKVYNFFGITVDHNCHEDADKRREVYEKCDVVYGILSCFQRDYLLTNFYNQGFLSNHHFKNVIVDEVDSMLLDKGNNILYLSQELPDIDEIESVFNFIWQWVNHGTTNHEETLEILKSENIRKAVLDNTYGVIDDYEVKKIIADDLNVTHEEILNNLKATKLINDECVLNVHNFDENFLKFPENCSEEIANRMKFYICQKLTSIKPIKFPKYLKNFVLHHLNKWIASAINALIMEDGKEYVIDRCRDGGIVQIDPNIIIVDLDTGTDQKNSQWDEGLCQFLQLKHGCRLSLISLKSVFISNVSYFKLYENLYGMSGTLGTLQERDKLKDFYGLDYVTIPTYLPRKFIEYEARLMHSQQSWMDKLIEEVKIVFDQNRSVLIICKTIRDIQEVYGAIKDSDKQYFNETNVHVYQRDYEDLKIELLQPRTLIIATNLAGRGTDFKLSKPLNDSGGLHIILVFLPSNVRIENQAFGRAARAGSKGSGRLIINRSSNESIEQLKDNRNQEEFTRLNAVSAYYKNFITIEEDLFTKFMTVYKEYSSGIEAEKELYEQSGLVDKISDTENFLNSSIGILNATINRFRRNTYEEAREILLENFKIFWSLWLDENSENLKNWQLDKTQCSGMQIFDEFLRKSVQVHYEKVKLHPVSRLKLFKYFDRVGRHEDARNVLLKDAQLDSVVFQYYINYINMKIESKTRNYQQRELSFGEIEKLKSNISDFETRELHRNARGCAIRALKEKYRRTLIPISGFERQEGSRNETENIFVDSMKSLLGKGITSESFTFAPFENEMFKEHFHEKLINEGLISKAKMADTFDINQVEKIAKKYHLSFEDLFNFLENQKNKTIDDFQSLSLGIMQNLIFASRETFWETLVDRKILTHEVRYAIIDLKKLEDFHPLNAKNLYEQYRKYKIKQLDVEDKCEIFFCDVDEDNELMNCENSEDKTPAKIAILLNVFERDTHFKDYCLKNLVTFNRRARFDMKNYDEIKKQQIFQYFDGISRIDIKDSLNDIGDLQKLGVTIRQLEDEDEGFDDMFTYRRRRKFRHVAIAISRFMMPKQKSVVSEVTSTKSYNEKPTATLGRLVASELFRKDTIEGVNQDKDVKDRQKETTTMPLKLSKTAAIIGKMIAQEILTSSDNQSFSLNYENISNMNLDENFGYETKIIELLKLKFANRIALQVLVKNIEDRLADNRRSSEIAIHLFPKPHLMIINDLVDSNIIKLPQVNKEKLEKLEHHEMFRKYFCRKGLYKLFQSMELPAFDTALSDELVNELLEKKVLFQIRIDSATLCGLKSIFNSAHNVLSGKFVFDIYNYFSKSDDGKTEKITKEKGLVMEYIKYLYSQYESSDILKSAGSFFNVLSNPNSGYFPLDNDSSLLLNPIIIDEFRMKEIKLSPKFASIERTVKVYLERQRHFIENKAQIIGILKSSVRSLRSDVFELPELVLVPLESLHPTIDYEILNFMHLKGLDVVIQVQEKCYSMTYFIRLGIVVLIGVVQIAIGVAITILSTGLLINVGSSIIGEGISDIIFALCTLRSGHFRWSDYRSHKITSVLTTATTFGITLGLSKFKCLEKFFGMQAATFGDNVAGKGFAGMSGLQMWRQGGEIRAVALKNMYKVFFQEVAVSSLKAVSMAGVSTGVDMLIEYKLDSITQALSIMITERIQGNFNTTKLSTTIDEMLEIYSTKELKELIEVKFRQMNESGAVFRSTVTTIGLKVDTIIQSGHGINAIVTGLSSLAVKALAIGSIGYEIATAFNKLNDDLIYEKSHKKGDKTLKIDDKEREEFKTEILESLNAYLSEQLKIAVNQNIIAPSLKYVANQAVNMAASTVVNFIKSIKTSRREAQFAKDAALIEAEMNELKEKDQLTEDDKLRQENLAKKARNIKGNTTCPETLSKLSKLNLPVGDVEMEAAARRLGITMVVMHNGIRHTFGNGDKIVEIDLADGHFANSTDAKGNISITNDCLYNKLNDKLQLSKTVSLDEFRNGIADTIVKDGYVREFVADPKRKFFHDIGFYGGYKKEITNKESGRIDVTDKKTYDDFMKDKNTLIINNKAKTFDNNADVRDDKDKVEFLDTEQYNKNKIEGVEQSIKMMNKVLDTIIPGLKVSLDDFETTNYDKVYNDDYTSSALYPVEMKVDTNKMNEKIKNIPNLDKYTKEKLMDTIKEIEINIDIPSKTDNGPNVGHVGAKIQSKFHKSGKLENTVFHVLTGQPNEKQNPVPSRRQNGMVPANEVANWTGWTILKPKDVFTSGGSQFIAKQRRN